MPINSRRTLLTWQMVNTNGYFPKKVRKQSEFINFLKWLIGR